MMASNAASGLSGRHHVSTRRCLAEKSHHGSSTAAKNAAAAPSSAARPAAAPRGRGCGRPAAPRWPPFSLRFTSGQQRQVQLADGRVVLEHKADAVVRAPEGDLRQPAQGVLPARHAPAALGGQLAADGGTGQCVCPHCARPRGLGGVEALQIGLHKIPVLFPPFVFNLQFLKKYSFTRSSAPLKIHAKCESVKKIRKKAKIRGGRESSHPPRHRLPKTAYHPIILFVEGHALPALHQRTVQATDKNVPTDCVCSGAHCAAVGGFAALRMRRAPCGL